MTDSPLYLRILEIAIAWITVGGYLWALYWLYQYVIGRVDQWRRRLREQKDSPNIALKLITASKARLAITIIFRLGILVSLILAIPAALSFSFSRFEETAYLSGTLIDWLREPAKAIFKNFLNYLPDLGFLIVWCGFIFVLIRLLAVLTRWVDSGLIVLPGFHREWAEPTYRILVFLIIAFGLVVAFPYLPGGKSPAFQGVSIFIGVLISIGSGSAIGNVISGIILTYTRAFRIGDRVKIGDQMGDVIEKSMFVTRLRTIKNEDIVIPNSMVMSAHVVNYTEGKNSGGLILYTTITIGYDAPWKTVHQLMIDAALRTDGILQQPSPFVFQTALNDFNVAYQINAYTDRPSEMARIYSDLHRHIQDTFNEGGVEIMSPNYHAIRDGNQTTIPPSYLPPDYQKPGFHMER